MRTSHTIFRIIGLFVASVLATGFLWAQTVDISPATNTVARGATFSLNVNLHDVTNLLASHVKVTFDNTKLQFNGATNGTFMPSGGFFGQSVNGNEISVDQSVLANPPAAGSGLLFTLSFTALDAVSGSGVTLAVDLRDPSNAVITAGTTGSSVTVENPFPHVSGISPTTKTSGDPTFDLTVNGSNFVPTSVVWFKGVARATTYGTASTLTATIPAADIVLAGTYPVTVVNPAPGGGTSTEVVNLTVVAGAAANIAITTGNGQTGTINTPLASPLEVRVTDAGGNPVSGTSVTFGIATQPPAATGQALLTTTASTDVNGLASTVLTLGNKVGGYTVTATSGSLNGSPVTFSATADPGPATTITLTSGSGQAATINSILPAPFVVTVTDAGGNPISGTSVTFAIASTPGSAAGQSLSTTTTTTDVSGAASTVLTLGNKVGAYTVTATSGTLTNSPITFSATATVGAAAFLTLSAGNSQAAPINTALGNPLVVSVTDIGGNPVSGTGVTFAIATAPPSAAGQFLGTTTTSTDVNGLASTALTLGDKVGTYTVTATSGILAGSPVTFSATAGPGSAATIALTSGSGQSATINSTLANPFVVTVTDAGGNPVPGARVTFAIVTAPPLATGQILGTTSATTDANGMASSLLTLGNKVGAYTVSATSGSLVGSPVTFSATATVGAAAFLSMTSGNGQSAPINTALGTPFVVTVTDIGGNPVPGTNVAFAMLSAPPLAAGQSLSTTGTITDGDGLASTILTLGNKVGSYSVTATSGTLGGSPVTFTATAGTGTATTITMTSGSGQTATINTALANPFVATVTDAGGNPVPGTNVTFAIATTPASAAGQALSQLNVLTDLNGQASSTLTLGSKVGGYTVTASSGTLTNSPLTYSATASAGAAAAIALTSGDGQSTAITTALANPFVVTVTDIGGNPVSGTNVTFAVMTTPATATGQALSTTTSSTDLNGVASTILTVGTKVGTYTVTATSGTLTNSPVTFSATATPGPLHHFEIGAIGTQTAGTSFEILIVAQDAENNKVDSFAGFVALSVNAGTISPVTSGTFTGGAKVQPVTVNVSGSGRIITVDDLAGHTGVSNPFEVLTMPGLFVSADPLVAAAGIVYPGTSWTTTAYDPNDWSFTGNPTVSFYIVPDPGMTFMSSTVTLTWDASVLGFATVDFGSQGSPNGIVGSGQSYPHTESFNQSLGPNTVTIVATRAGGMDFPVISGGDYIARVDFHLLKPGYATVGVQGANFQRTPSSVVQVASHAGALKAYLGDVASGPAPAGEVQGDGVINFEDLSSWSSSYWSGVAGYPGGLANYKVKYDFGPTADGNVFTLPAVDTKIDFEDLVIFSISYGLSSTHQLPKAASPPKEPVIVSLGQPSVNGNETRIPVMVEGAVTDVRAMRLELKGQFGSFLGVEKGSLLQEYNSPVMLLSRNTDGQVFVDLAVMGLDARALNRSGEVAVLRFAGTTHVTLTRNEARTSGNQPMAVVKVRGAGEALPTSYGLKQNYPNPFNPTTTIEFEMPQAGEVTLEVYNMLGQLVTTLVQEVREAGFYQVQWNGRDASQHTVASGVFFYRLKAGEYTQVKRMLMLK